MAGFGINRFEEEKLKPQFLQGVQPVQNRLSFSIARQGPSRGTQFLADARSALGDPSISAGETTLRRPSIPEANTLERFRESAKGIGNYPQRFPVTTTEVVDPKTTKAPLQVQRGLNNKLDRSNAPVLDDIDFGSLSGLIKGFGSVAKFTSALQKFNRGRGISPGGKRAPKLGDIRKKIEALRVQLLENPIGKGSTEEEILKNKDILDQITILDQMEQEGLGIGGIRRARSIDEENDLAAISAL